MKVAGEVTVGAAHRGRPFLGKIVSSEQRAATAGRPYSFTFSRLIFFAVLLLFVSLPALAQTKRLVVIKCDGLPYDVVDQFVKQRDPQSGKSVLPWIDYIFYQRGARLSNFYVRGMSLSAPSWVAVDASGVYIVDFSNNRILYYPGTTTTATRVYGQAGSFANATANNGGLSADSLSGPMGITLDYSGIYVADPNNNRVLVY